MRHQYPPARVPFGTLGTHGKFHTFRLSYLALENSAILCKVTFVGYPWDPSWGPDNAFRTLSCSESERDVTIGFSYLDLVHFHT